jgi:DNA-binding NarL/FixJ family response regulator
MSAAATPLPQAPEVALPALGELRDAAVAACDDPDAATPNLCALWRAIVEGRFRFVECFDRNGWRYFVLHENLEPSFDAQLTSRESYLVDAVGRGESEKAVAFGLGVKPSTASALLKSALTKLGLRSKMDLVVLVGALRHMAARTRR